ncbi:unnamed protein product [Toxocara canis]|uniref:RRM domain-containing protein n=1 Tax=Toxocara canis TaxID=6265 RepID=A0A183UFE3_TOXCA|nr:unnamed protein product [Toxocara canis]
MSNNFLVACSGQSCSSSALQETKVNGGVGNLFTVLTTAEIMNCNRSYSGSPPRRRSRSPRRSGYGYSRYSPRRSRYNDGRDNPEPCACLGVFGMSLNTTERDLKRIFGEYGEIETVQLVYDRYSGRSRGFGFVYFQTTKEAMRAKEHLRDAVIDGMRVRVDFSVTKGAPT